MRSVRLSGYALHAGVVTAVTLALHDGPLTFEQNGIRVPLAEARVVGTDLGVTIGHPAGIRITLVEHLLAAVGGLAWRSGLIIKVEGSELPLLDGGARAYGEALRALSASARPAAAHLAVTRRATVHSGDSTYHFAPGEAVALGVRVAFDHPAIGVQAWRWDGAPESFMQEIAPARTFGFRADAEALWARGRARLAAHPEGLNAFERAVMVFGEAGAPTNATVPPNANEVARHKLLDLLGDLTLHGGPPVGSLTAERPGHRATHDIVPRALASGLLRPV